MFGMSESHSYYDNRTVHSFYFSNGMQCRSPEICMLHASANFEMLNTQFFSNK